jgi:heme/copper-type cytochrome/quinol oxidase subunit 2
LNEWILISALIIAVLVVIILIITVVMFKKKKEGKTGEINYKVFFIIGLTWIPIGSVYMIAVNLVIGIAFMGMGVSYLAIGLVNKDKWEKK